MVSCVAIRHHPSRFYKPAIRQNPGIPRQGRASFPSAEHPPSPHILLLKYTLFGKLSQRSRVPRRRGWASPAGYTGPYPGRRPSGSRRTSGSLRAGCGGWTP